MFMYPMTFDEFLLANNEDLLLEARNAASSQSPLPEPLHEKLVSLLRTYMLVGGMPEWVGKWVETHDYLLCALNLLILAGLLIPVTHTSANHPNTYSYSSRPCQQGKEFISGNRLSPAFTS